MESTGVDRSTDIKYGDIVITEVLMPVRFSGNSGLTSKRRAIDIMGTVQKVKNRLELPPSRQHITGNATDLDPSLWGGSPPEIWSLNEDELCKTTLSEVDTILYPYDSSSEIFRILDHGATFTSTADPPSWAGRDRAIRALFKKVMEEVDASNRETEIMSAVLNFIRRLPGVKRLVFSAPHSSEAGHRKSTRWNGEISVFEEEWASRHKCIDADDMCQYVDWCHNEMLVPSHLGRALDIVRSTGVKHVEICAYDEYPGMSKARLRKFSKSCAPLRGVSEVTIRFWRYHRMELSGLDFIHQIFPKVEDLVIAGLHAEEIKSLRWMTRLLRRLRRLTIVLSQWSREDSPPTSFVVDDDQGPPKKKTRSGKCYNRHWRTERAIDDYRTRTLINSFHGKRAATAVRDR